MANHLDLIVPDLDLDLNLDSAFIAAMDPNHHNFHNPTDNTMDMEELIELPALLSASSLPRGSGGGGGGGSSDKSLSLPLATSSTLPTFPSLRSPTSPLPFAFSFATATLVLGAEEAEAQIALAEMAMAAAAAADGGGEEGRQESDPGSAGETWSTHTPSSGAGDTPSVRRGRKQQKKGPTALERTAPKKPRQAKDVIYTDWPEEVLALRHRGRKEYIQRENLSARQADDLRIMCRRYQGRLHQEDHRRAEKQAKKDEALRQETMSATQIRKLEATIDRLTAYIKEHLPGTNVQQLLMD